MTRIFALLLLLTPLLSPSTALADAFPPQDGGIPTLPDGMPDDALYPDLGPVPTDDLPCPDLDPVPTDDLPYPDLPVPTDDLPYPDLPVPTDDLPLDAGPTDPPASLPTPRSGCSVAMGAAPATGGSASMVLVLGLIAALVLLRRRGG